MITKSLNNLKDLDFEAGEVLLFDKPLNYTSFKVVHIVRKHLGVKKVGHAGTLDPKATGLLILCTGKKTKEITKYQEQKKTYTGTILLGATTPTMDMETAPENHKEIDYLTDDQLLQTSKELTGQILQVPPMFSAIKLNGKTLYNLARKGKTVEREARQVEVESFELTNMNLPYVDFKIVCSKGTYIRVIANDFGEKLGCGGLLYSLRRTHIGDYSVDDALTEDEFLSSVRELKKEEIL